MPAIEKVCFKYRILFIYLKNKLNVYIKCIKNVLGVYEEVLYKKWTTILYIQGDTILVYSENILKFER